MSALPVAVFIAMLVFFSILMAWAMTEKARDFVLAFLLTLAAGVLITAVVVGAGYGAYVAALALGATP